MKTLKMVPSPHLDDRLSRRGDLLILEPLRVTWALRAAPTSAEERDHYANQQMREEKWATR